MSDDKKTEKKIAKRREDILFWLKAAEKYANQYKQAVDEKKKAKSEKSLQSAKESIQFAVNAAIDLGGSIDDIPETLSKEQLEIWNEMFGNADSDDIAIEKEIQRIKKMLNEDLKEAMEKYNYDPEDTVEIKQKSKLFEKEAYISWNMMRASNPKSVSGAANKHYNDSWNYARDYDSTKDKYFSPEEQKLIANCMQTYEAELAYYRQKRAWMGRLGESLCKTAEKIGEWGDITQARMWADNLSKEAFPKAVKDIEGRKLSKEELAEKSKAMTRRYIQFIGDPKAIEEAMNHDREAEAEAERLLNELRRSADEARPLLSGRDRREIEETLEAVESEVEGQGVLAYKLLEDKLGYEKALFIALYKHDSNKEDRRELLTGYSFEELGL